MTQDLERPDFYIKSETESHEQALKTEGDKSAGAIVEGGCICH
jgi:hypothetical protein